MRKSYEQQVRNQVSLFREQNKVFKLQQFYIDFYTGLKNYEELRNTGKILATIMFTGNVTNREFLAQRFV